MNDQRKKDYDKAVGEDYRREPIKPAEAVPVSTILLICAIFGLILLIIPVIAGMR